MKNKFFVMDKDAIKTTGRSNKLRRLALINPINYGRTSFRPPFGLMVIKALFEERGVEVLWIDCDVNRHDQEYLLKKLNKNNDIQMIVIGGMHTTYLHVKEIFKQLKDNDIDLPTLVGGRLALTLDYMLWEKIPNLDMVCKVEGENVVHSICNNFPNFDKVKGIQLRVGGDIVDNGPVPIKKHLNDWPRFNYEMLGPKYFEEHRAFLLSSIGCPYKCSFCRTFEKSADKVRTMTVDKFFEEQILPFLTYDMAGTGVPIQLFTMVDEFFLLYKERAHEFCDAVEKYGLQGSMMWRCSGRADIIKRIKKDVDLLKRMVDCGAEGLNMGLESGSQIMLNNMNKSVKVQQYEDTIATCREAGMNIFATFIFGLPGETRETALESVAWRKKMGLGGKYFYATPYPGTDLYRGFKEKYAPTIDEEESYFLNAPSLKKLSVNLSGMSDQEFFDVDQECREELAKITTNLDGWLGVAEKD